MPDSLSMLAGRVRSLGARSDILRRYLSRERSPQVQAGLSVEAIDAAYAELVYAAKYGEEFFADLDARR